MSRSTRGDEAHASSRSAPRWRWWVPLAMFVAGVVVGVLGVGLLNATTPEFLAQASAGAAPPSGSGGDQGAVPVTAEARVNAACLRIINEAQDISTVLTGVDDAVTDVDLQRLDDIVRQLQPLEPRLQRDLRDCRVDAAVVAGQEPSSAASPEPPRPSPSATR